MLLHQQRLLLSPWWLCYFDWIGIESPKIIGQSAHYMIKADLRTLTTRFKICAKQRTRVRGPWNPSRSSLSSSTKVLLLAALSTVNPNLGTCMWQSDGRIPCHESRTHANMQRYAMQGIYPYGLSSPCKKKVIAISYTMRREQAYFTKSRISDLITPSEAQWTVNPINEMTLGDVHPSAHRWSFPGYA